MPDQVNGFVLTRELIYQGDSQTLRFWLKPRDGTCQPLDITAEASVGFIRSEDIDRVKGVLRQQSFEADIRTLKLKDFNQQPMAGLYCRQWAQLRKITRALAKKGIRVWEDDIHPGDRYLMERFITAGVDVRWQERKVVLRPMEVRPEFDVLSLDIETSFWEPGTLPELYSIALASRKRQWVGWVRQQAQQQCSHGDAQAYDTVEQLFRAFLDQIEQINPDIIVGWNVVNFDLRILQQWADKLGLDFVIGRDQQMIRWFQPFDHRDQWRCDISGRVVLDGIDSLRTAFYQFDSYALDAVANEVLGRGKLLAGDHRAEAIEQLYREDTDQLVAYNLEDCVLVLDIFDQLKLLDFLVERSYLTGLSLDRIGGSAAAFSHLYLPRLHRNGYVAPSVGSQVLNFHSPGGYVMDSVPGIYQNVLVLDFKSLYPSIIQTFCVDPYGMAEALAGLSNDPLEGFDGALFDRQRHILPGLIRDLSARRDQAKLQKNQPLSQAIKIIMNSFYGILGSHLCRFYDPRLSSSITKRGHQILQQSKQWIEQMGYQVIYGDTDSVFVWIEKEVDHDQAMSIGKQLAHDLNLRWQQELLKRYQLDSYLEIQFETHYLRFLMPTIRGENTGSKKRYAGMIVDDQQQPKLVFKGLESVRSDWTALAKIFQQNLYRKVFLKQDYRQYVSEFVQSLFAGQSDDLLVYRRRLRKPVEQYQKNVPPHVQAARLWQQHYPNRRINRIEYVMTVNGVEPVEFQQSALDYDFYLEKQVRPIAEAIFMFTGDSFADLTEKQMPLL
ncbi:DNA polymerase II [Gynuella sunshinyii]|uniref:DNA polymerase n=1 Tax=Gynuella sunshinyii YC6258 TaxID=1445510 RepID=A0A0C5VHY6_9GAMM|nr:DNA polymerase II [Gynuella sunshinyii]AJQ93881.1 DNA polymerase elongation subunit (family B) [Gynuella sunshinyii YC6258]